MAADVKKALETLERLEGEKRLWNTHWQLVHEYFLQRKADFTAERESGAFLNSDVWTGKPGSVAEIAASAILGMVWPDNNSFMLEPFGEEVEDDEEIKEWFESSTKEMQSDMDDAEAGLALALDEFMLDYLVSGTPAIHAEEGERSTFRFDAWNVQQFAIEEGPNGFVDTFYRVREYTVRQAVKKFGLDKLSKETQKLHKDGKLGEKFKVLHVIEPRDVQAGKGYGAQNMPFASCYYEIERKHLIRESGYHELPTFCSRYSKRIGEKYGRSPAMRSLPDVLELNAIWELVTIGMEKNFDPPLAMYDDGTFGAGTIDTSAGALNVLNVSGKLTSNRSPIEPIFTVGNFNDIAVLIERLEQTLNDHFMIDRLLDLDNEKEMTAREALIRQAMRQKALRSVISRLLVELFTPLIERCFNIALRKGRFGFVAGSPEAIAWQAVNPGKEMKVIPDKIAQMQGERMYKVRYMTPAAREAMAAEAEGMLNMYQIIGEVSQFDQTVLDLPNNERGLKRLGDIWSVPQEFWNDEDELKVIQEGKAAVQEESAGMNKAAMAASIAKDATQAQNNVAKSQQVR